MRDHREPARRDLAEVAGAIRPTRVPRPPRRDRHNLVQQVLIVQNEVDRSQDGIDFDQAPLHRPEMLNPFARRNLPSWVATAARLGHLSTGTVHCLVGALAITAALDPLARATGSQGALRELASRQFGSMLLIGLGLGLLVDSFWQGVRAGTDADLAGPGLRGALERLGWILSGLIHLGLGVAALRLVRDVPPGRPESHTKAWTATVMAIPFGRGLVALVALTILVVAGVMLVRAGRAALDPWLDVTQMSSRTRILTTVLVGLGLATRATVYTIVAGFSCWPRSRPIPGWRAA